MDHAESGKIGWGILSTGGIAAKFAADLALLPQAKVVAVGSRTTEAAQQFAARFDIPQAYGDWDSLIADPRVDVIYVANTNNGHYAATKRCLEAGKPVLCEKPFTLNAAGAEELVTLASQRGVFLMEAMWMYTNPAIIRLCEQIAAGAIGAVTAVTASFGLPGPFTADHRLRDPHQGGGALLDLGVYPLSLARLILGQPSTISAVGSRTAQGVDAASAVALGYPDGSVSALTSSLTADMPTRATISGTKGHIELAEPFYCPDRFQVSSTDGTVHTVEVPYLGGGMAHEAAEVMRCLEAGLTQSPLVPWESTLDVMSTLDEIRRQLGVRFPDEHA